MVVLQRFINLPFGANLYYYDVNSLYPYVALQDMPGLQCSKIQYYSPTQSINGLFGFLLLGIKNPFLFCIAFFVSFM